jgi:hypothetical protein
MPCAEELDPPGESSGSAGEPGHAVGNFTGVKHFRALPCIRFGQLREAS